jgi:NAD(P)-dependent dehydrogenase (short-subunit alcohol dehydrogenase family)
MWSFEDKNVIVTGAARGIGRAVALAFAEHGANLALLDRDAAGLVEMERTITDSGRRAVSITVDVSREEQVEAASNRIFDSFGHVDVLVNNAGVNRRIPLRDWKSQDWTDIIAVNFVGVYLMTRAIGLRMSERGSGTIVNLSALGGGIVGLGRGSEVYTGTKAAVAAMTRDFAAEWAHTGVRVNCVAPGWIETDMNAPLLRNATMQARVTDRVPLGRWGQPEDVAGPVLFLASDAARYITGHLLPVDGGAATIIRLTDHQE